MENKELAKVIRNRWQEFDGEGSLGLLESMVVDMGTRVGEIPTTIKSAMLLMCGDHGIAKYGVSAFPPEVTIQMINNYMTGKAGANVMARHAGADVFVVDVGVNADLSHLPRVINKKVAYGTNDFTEELAMSVEQVHQALAAGAEVANQCIDDGYNMMITAEMGIGNTTSTAAIASAMLDLPVEATVGRGTGINDARLLVKKDVVRRGLELHKPEAMDGIDVLSKVGGYDHAALAGMIIAAAKRKVPTMVDGVNATAAALIAYRIYPPCKDYMFCSHLSVEIAHKKMLEVLELEPIVDAGMRLGEGTGASLAIVILQKALDLYHNA